MAKKLISVATVVSFMAILAVSFSSFAADSAPGGGAPVASHRTPDAPAWKNDGAGGTACVFDTSQICPSTATLIAQGVPIAVPTLPPSGLVILGILIVTTTAYTLRKQ